MSKRVIVLGGGVIGLSCAFSCRMRGYQVTLLEIGRCGGQASGAAAGMLAPFSENAESADDFFRLCLASLRLYPQWAEDVKRESGADFEYTESGSLYAAYHEADLLAMESRLRWQREFANGARIVDGAELRRLEPELSGKVVAAIHHPEESHIYAPHYVKALELACRNSGVEINDGLEQVSIAEWRQDVELRSKDGNVFRGERLVVCSGAWTRELERTFGLDLPVYPIRGQVCAYSVPVGTVRHMVFGSQGYVVAKENGSLVCGASEDVAGFDTTVTEKGIARLRRWNKQLYPFLEEMEPFHRWAGLRPATQDGYPLLGALRDAEHIVFAAGHYRNGILLSPATGTVAADLVDGGRAEAGRLAAFAPERFTGGL